jgi:hypothetical protein
VLRVKLCAVSQAAASAPPCASRRRRRFGGWRWRIHADTPQHAAVSIAPTAVATSLKLGSTAIRKPAFLSIATISGAQEIDPVTVPGGELDTGGTLWAGVDEGEGAALAMTGMYASRKWTATPSSPQSGEWVDHRRRLEPLGGGPQRPPGGPGSLEVDRGKPRRLRRHREAGRRGEFLLVRSTEPDRDTLLDMEL